MASKYKKELEGMTWSFSRITTFLKCPYKFYLIYIEKADKRSKFHAEYGKFIHSILEKYFKREFNEQQCLDYYIENFDEDVTAYIRDSTRDKLYMAGIDYFTNLEWKYDDYEILEVEKEARFKVDKYNFIGFIDVLLKHKETGEITVLDHKTGEFPIGKRGGVLKNKLEEYENYKKQLYLYSLYVKNTYGIYPTYIKWNYTRSSDVLQLPFIEEEFEATKTWIFNSLKLIFKEKVFNPECNYVNCKMLCDVEDECEYNLLGESGEE
jgi:hypothetical protein